jgi:trimeric autotransporter adhesin
MKKISLLFFLGVSSLFSNPSDPTCVRGEIKVSLSGKEMQIQASDGSIVNWKSFSIGEGEMARFVQPSSDSSVLNRVVGNSRSELLGQLLANGHLILLNSHGILIGKGATIDTEGFLASTLNLSDEDFLQKKELLFRGDSQECIENFGTIHTRKGDVILLARMIKNNGLIEAKTGKVTLGAGCEILLKTENSDQIFIRPSLGEDWIENKGQISSIQTEVKAEPSPYAKAIQLEGAISASTLVSKGGKILLASAKNLQNQGILSAKGGALSLKGETIVHTGTCDVSGDRAGSVDMECRQFLSGGQILANSTKGPGGSIHLRAQEGIVETSSSVFSASGEKGGEIVSEVGRGNHRLFTSGRYEALGKTEGGQIHLLGPDLCLVDAHIDASGQKGGGEVLIGGDLQGKNPKIPNAQKLYVSGSTKISADALRQGNGGKVILWSEGQTDVYGKISSLGGSERGDGGLIEISGKEHLSCLGQVETQAFLGKAGTLLLDPANIVIDDVTGIYPQYQLINPNIAGGGNFGTKVVALSSGNVVVTNPTESSSAGAVYLFNGKTAALISALRGSQSSDQVGSDGITQLLNGNYVVTSSWWANGVSSNAGAVTYCSKINGLTGLVSASNSLVGSLANDRVGMGGIIVSSYLPNASYLVVSTRWANAGASQAGAITFCPGATGLNGAVTSLNSLVGSSTNDTIGNGGITVLPNGNYVVSSYYWDNGGMTDAGAVTLCKSDGTTIGSVSSSNSLVGTSLGDTVGEKVVALSNNNYLVLSPHWTASTGAATWCKSDGTTTGNVSALNSLVGSAAGDRVGENGYLLPNGNYVVTSSYWNSQRGAVTCCENDGSSVGTINAFNSLVGSSSGDYVGGKGIFILTNGNYVVSSPLWANGAATQAGAVTWCNANGSTVGAVSVGNSLVGSTIGDQIGDYSATYVGIKVLPNGDYVVGSPLWSNGASSRAGAATLCSGDGTTIGPVTVANSLVGSVTNDSIANEGITVLSNGNYVVVSSVWTFVNSFGAVTWCSANGTTTGAVTSLNSLVGSHNNDYVGRGGIGVLSNGCYVVDSRYWNSVSGAVTWCRSDGTTVGVVNSSNSLVGTLASDGVGSNGVTVLSNGNYVVSSPSWSSSMGAVTLCSASSGLSGAVSAANSLVGSLANDQISSGGIIDVGGGSYLVSSPSGVSTRGAVTFCESDGSPVGIVTTQNSVVGGAPAANAQVAVLDSVNSTFICPFINENSGTVRIGLFNPNELDYLRAQNQTITTTTAFITDTLNEGGNVILQATNNLTINSPLQTTAASNLTLQAGGSIFLNANIDLDGGELAVVVDSLSPSLTIGPLSQLVIGPGVSISVGRAGFWTDVRASNSIDPSVRINGSSVSFGPYFLNSPQEVWGTFYPQGTINPNFPFFTFFYKEGTNIDAIVRAQDQSAAAWGEFFTLLRPFNEWIVNYLSFEIFDQIDGKKKRKSAFLRQRSDLIQGMKEERY